MTIPKRIMFACGQLGVMVLVRFFLQWLLDYSAQEPSGLSGAENGAGAAASGATVVLFNLATVGTLLLAARLFDGITDPIAGVLSDRWVRSGRERRTLLWFALLLPPVGLALSFYAGHDLAAASRWMLLTSGMVVFFLGYTFYAIPYWSLIDDYSGDDVGERRILSNLLGLGLLLATAVVAVVSPFVIEALGYRHAALVFAACALLLMALPHFAQPKRAQAPAERPLRAKQTGIYRDVVSAFRHRRFVAVLVLYAGSQMSFTVMTGAVPFIVQRLLCEGREHVSSIMAPFLGTAIPFFVFAPAISRRLGWEKACAVASILLGIVYGGTAALGEGVLGMTPLVTAMALFACGGPMAAVLLGLEGEAITDCAREREGEEVTSLYFGVFNFVVKAMNGLAIFLTSLFVSWEAYRGTGLLAGGLLFVGVMGYYAIRGVPRGSGPS
ncbi:MFS transporter [Planctomycetota bacterium]